MKSSDDLPTGRSVTAIEEVRVSSRTNVQDLAWVIHKSHVERKRVCLLAIGVQAVNQAIKAVAIANGRGASQGVVATVLPAMENVEISNDQGDSVERTIVKLILVPYIW